ncbi:MAG: peptidyl-tRNA hydrolase Pth2 [Candidatus Bathyarchaeia archaeon]|nr:peptidyl-tRNA hydrolase Pth2 [Candidatus Bathyarchaeota archaeon]
MSFKYKQVIVVRSDLKMSKGKIAVQVAHAAVSAAEKARNMNEKEWQEWIQEGQKKVVVKVKSLEELLKLMKESEKAGLPTVLIEDKGLTEIPPGTITCLGIGPALSEKIDKITGNLPLL